MRLNHFKRNISNRFAAFCTTQQSRDKMNPICENKIWYNPQELTASQLSMIETLSEFYPISTDSSSDAIKLEVSEQNSENQLTVAISDDCKIATVSAPDSTCFGRAILNILAGTAKPGLPITQVNHFKTYGIMLDCSRNAVMKVEHFKKWLNCLALLGYNTAMLYTEDTYELPGEQYFGYQRGRYTKAELIEIDQHASKLGIEMIACIQTLGHMEQILKWNIYSDIKDNQTVMLIDEPKTYELIEKMIALFAEVFSSRRIHVGMDETWGLGRGAFIDKFGVQDRFEIMNRHLAKVDKLCQKHGLAPMIWSDMYFQMGSTTHAFYDESVKFSDDVKNAIPRNAELVYWDYYHDNEENYLNKIAAHENLHGKPIVASGVWTWGSTCWYGVNNTEKNAGAAIEACKKANISELFFTMWGDDGAYCEFNSALAGIAWCAEKNWASCDESSMQKIFAALTGGDYKTTASAGDINEFASAMNTIWDDPIQRIYWKSLPLRKDRTPMVWYDAVENFESKIELLEPIKDIESPCDFAHLYNVLTLARAKIILNTWLDRAYTRKAMKEITQIVGEIPSLIELTEKVEQSFRRQWLRRNKSQGLEVIQIRLAGQKARLAELERTLTDLVEEKIDRIPEFEETPTEFSAGHFTWGDYHQRASSSCIL